MICDYSHTVTQYAGYKAVSWSSSECCRFLLHNRGIRIMLRKIHHTRSARRLTTTSISFCWRRFLRLGDLLLDQWNAQLLGCRLGNNVSLVSTLYRRLHQCTAAIQSSETAACESSRAHSEVIRGPTWKNQRIQFLAASTCSCVSFIPQNMNCRSSDLAMGQNKKESSSVHTIAACHTENHRACDPIMIPLTENKHVTPHFSWWLATISIHFLRSRSLSDHWLTHPRSFAMLQLKKNQIVTHVSEGQALRKGHFL